MICGDRLHDLRKALNMSMDELSIAIGISKVQLSRYENEKSDPSSRVVIAFANYFKVSADYLLGLTEAKTPMPPKSPVVTVSLSKLALIFGAEGAAKFLRTMGVPLKLEDLEKTETEQC
jgi:transcriptional regulator with XRE-family HTH domain